MSTRVKAHFGGRVHTVDLEGRTVTAGMVLAEVFRRECISTDLAGWKLTHRGRGLTAFDVVLHGWEVTIRASED